MSSDESTSPPAAFGGLFDPIFEVTADLGRFGRAAWPERLQVFAPALPPPRLPAAGDGALPPPFAAEHAGYTPPSGIYAYAVPDATLWGHGLVTAEARFVAPADCIPPYLRGQLAEQPHTLHPVHAGPLGRSDLATIAADVPVVSVLHPNLFYPRFLLEIFPRLYVASVLRAYGVACRLAWPDGLPGWATEFVAALGLDDITLAYDARRQRVTAPSLILPSMLHRDYSFHPALNLAVQLLTARAGAPPADSPTHLYLSRSPHSQRRIENEDTLAQGMASLGFTVVQLHAMPLLERVRLLAGARVVAGEYGPALHDALFAPPGARIISINFANDYQSKLARVRGQSVAFIPAADGLFRHWRLTRGASETYAVDLGAVRDMVAAVAPEMR